MAYRRNSGRKFARRRVAARVSSGQLLPAPAPDRAILLAALLLGCGARAPVDGSPDEEQFGTAGAGAVGGVAGRGGGQGGRGGAPLIDPAGPIDVGGVPLPPCEPGFTPSAAGSPECTFVFRGDCFEDPLIACACACQGLADNRCIIGGFLNPDEPQRVSCVQL